MPTRFVTLIFCAFIFFSAFGNSNIDSLLFQLSVCSDSNRYSVLTQLADAYYFDSQVQLAASYYKKATLQIELAYEKLRYFNKKNLLMLPFK